MTEHYDKLSAFLDGELGPEDVQAVTAWLESDPEAQAALDAIIEADAEAREVFDAQLDDPVPLALARQINQAVLVDDTPVAANQPRRPIWSSVAAGVALLVMGGAGGYLANDQLSPDPVPAGWIAQVADYHGVYASQNRHLVEVAADEADHIQTWLGNTVGASFTIPDLSGFGLTFEGGRLLVAGGKPVAQLMYRLEDGTVVALCLQRSDKDPNLPPNLNQQTINGFDFLSWSANGADYVVIGPAGKSDLEDIAMTAAVEV